MKSNTWQQFLTDLLSADNGNLAGNKDNLAKVVDYISRSRINILIVGATGVGKSSTINALFDMERAKVNHSLEPETSRIDCYELNNLILWDSPGLGDGIKDNLYKEKLIAKLNEKDQNGQLLIDLVLLVVDASTRDYGTVFNLINEVIKPNLGNETEERLLLALNKADKVNNGDGWDQQTGEPEKILIDTLDETVVAVRERIRDAVSLDLVPMYYSAGYRTENRCSRPYNLAKLLSHIVEHLPSDKRLAIIPDINKSTDNFSTNDIRENHSEKVSTHFLNHY